MQEIHQQRLEARAAHKEHLLTEARNGNCRAIAHIRASAMGGQSEGSYIQRHALHESAPVTQEEILKDKRSRIPRYFTALIQGRQELPVLMARVHRRAPPYSGHQIGCRPGVQAADGIMAAQSTLQLLRQTRVRAFAAKIDIRAAFDSLSQAAVFRWLMDCSPGIECERLFQLLQGTSVELALGGETHRVSLDRGLMQGTAYSADVFSRVMDYFLAPLHDVFSRQFSDWDEYCLSLPHFIIYADDIVVFAETPAALQSKLQQIIDVLATIGLEVNPDKSCVMASHDGCVPGVFLRGRGLPLQSQDSLVFLGVPLHHSPNPQLIITHLLRKTSNAYYGFKRIMDAGQAPIATRLHIFNTFITSKWAWAAPLLMPNARALRRLEAAKNTFLLSLFRLPTDPLMSWVDNTITRRRAVKVICRQNGGPDWRKTWLLRQWSYLGHLARTSHLQPMMRILKACGLSSSIRPVPRPAWLADLLIRRVQRVYQTWPWATMIPAWEAFAQDRIQWANHASWWVSHWVQDDAVPSIEYLQERQVVILRGKQGILDCFLRPAKDFTEVPYTTSLPVIKHGKMPGSFVWGKAEQGRCAVIVSLCSNPKQAFVVHTMAHDCSLQAMSAAVLRLACKVRGILLHFGAPSRIFMGAHLLQRTVFHGHVPLALLADSTEALNLLDSQGLDCLVLPPLFKPHSPWLALHDSVTLPAVHTKYLVRSLDFSAAFFCTGAQELADAMHRVKPTPRAPQLPLAP
ncbi:pol [Symbiodinium sp. CCMP2456]|nr:pol [Symbiodinium sp. CCMP2456]